MRRLNGVEEIDDFSKKADSYWDEYVPTGFPKLDAAIGGGLSTGLTILCGADEPYKSTCFLPFRQKECHLISPAAIGRRVCRAGEIGLLSDGKVVHIMAFIPYFFRGQKRVRIKCPAGYQKAHR